MIEESGVGRDGDGPGAAVDRGCIEDGWLMISVSHGGGDRPRGIHIEMPGGGWSTYLASPEQYHALCGALYKAGQHLGWAPPL